MRNSAADRDRADMDIAKIDVPAFVRGFQIAAGAEGGHALLKRRPATPRMGSGEPHSGAGDEARQVGRRDSSGQRNGPSGENCELVPPLGMHRMVLGAGCRRCGTAAPNKIQFNGCRWFANLPQLHAHRRPTVTLTARSRESRA
jgi:hypothetical protein